MSDNEQRKREAAERFNIANAKRIEMSFQDKVKVRIIQYTNDNPQWTVESLKATINALERAYGLRNRYEPPKNATNAVEEVVNEHDSDRVAATA